MKWMVLVLVMQAIFCNRLKTAAQNNTTNTTIVMPVTSDMSIMTESIDIPMSIASPSSIEPEPSSIIPMDNTSMTMLMTPNIEATSSGIFTMTITTILMPNTSMTPSATISPEESTSSMSSPTTVRTPSILIAVPNPTAESQSDDEGLSTGVIIGIAAGGAAAVAVIIIILCVCFCCCYQKHHREESYSMGPTVTARYWDANHPNDAGPGHVTSGGSMRSRTSWRDSLRSFTRGSLRRSLSLRRSSKRAKDKQQPSEYIGLYSTPL